MAKRSKLMLSSSISALALLASACGHAEGPTGYDRLCEVYQEVAPQDIDLDEKEDKIAETVEEDLPEVYVNYKNIVWLPPGERYEAIKSLAATETGDAWECEAMRVHFDSLSP